MKITGHKTDSIFRRYLIVDEELLAQLPRAAPARIDTGAERRLEAADVEDRAREEAGKGRVHEPAPALARRKGHEDGGERHQPFRGPRSGST